LIRQSSVRTQRESAALAVVEGPGFLHRLHANVKAHTATTATRRASLLDSTILPSFFPRLPIRPVRVASCEPSKLPLWRSSVQTARTLPIERNPRLSQPGSATCCRRRSQYRHLLSHTSQNGGNPRLTLPRTCLTNIRIRPQICIQQPHDNPHVCQSRRRHDLPYTSHQFGSSAIDSSRRRDPQHSARPASRTSRRVGNHPYVRTRREWREPRPVSVWYKGRTQPHCTL
jgi:hypothetical protein